MLMMATSGETHVEYCVHVGGNAGRAGDPSVLRAVAPMKAQSAAVHAIAGDLPNRACVQSWCASWFADVDYDDMRRRCR